MRKFFDSVLVCAGIALSLCPSFAASGDPVASDLAVLAESRPIPNPFTGSWSGTFVNLETGLGGTIEWTISEHGRLVGSFVWDDGGSGRLVGAALPNGVMHVAALRGGGGYTGEASLDADGDMLVLATDNDSGALYFIELSRL